MPKTIKQLYRDDLARSGITEAQGKTYGFKLFEKHPDKTFPADIYPPGTGYTIPYPGVPGYYRFRYLGDLPRHKDGKPIKYTQPRHTRPHIYFPANVAWGDVLADSDVALVIAEGEKKAIAGANAGFAVVGLGGAWGWVSENSSKLSDELLPYITVGRRVYLALDNDVRTNPGVCLANARLCKIIMGLGAIPVSLEFPAEDKCGLDDYIMLHGKGALATLVEQTEPAERFNSLQVMNAECAVISVPPRVMHDGVLKHPREVAEFYANRNFTELAVKSVAGENRVVLKEYNAYSEWRKSPLRRAHTRLVLRPDEGAITHDNCLNMFPGFTTPSVGPVTDHDVAPALAHFRRICGGNEQAYTALLRFAAWPLQNPGTHLPWALLIYGRGTGTGKNLCADLIASTRGRSTTELSGRHLGSEFNSETANMTLLRYNETKDTQYAENVYSYVKDMITSSKRRINTKGVPAYEIDNYLQIIITSNEVTPLKLSDNDRRFLVLHIEDNPLTTTEADEIGAWLNGDGTRGGFNGTGPPLLTRWLMGYDLGGLSQHDTPPKTDALRELAASSASVLDTFVAALLAEPDTVLVLGKSVLGGGYVTLGQIRGCYEAASPENRASGKTLAARLRHFGVPPARHSEPIRCHDGVHKLWCVRGAPPDISPAEIAAHYAVGTVPGAARPIGASKKFQKVTALRIKGAK